MATGESSNLAEIVAWLDRLVDAFDFTLPGVDGSLGRDLAGVVAREIAARSANAQDPDGNEWAPNEPGYAQWKAKRYRIGTFVPNYRTGQMLSYLSLLGNPEIAPDAVVMQYGLGETPTRSATGATLSRADAETTDIEKAFFCSKSRPFYALDAATGDALKETAQEALDKLVGEAR